MSFETKWAEMIVKHDVVDNPNLVVVHDLRGHFVPSYSWIGSFFPSYKLNLKVRASIF